MDFFSEFFFNLLLLVVILIVIGLIYKVVRTSIDHYNDFKRDQNLIQGNFAHIKVALKKRLDMITLWFLYWGYKGLHLFDPQTSHLSTLETLSLLPVRRIHKES